MEKQEISVKCLADAIIQVKKERFGENFVSIDDFFIIEKVIELRLKQKGYNAIFSDLIYNSHFRIDNNVIIKTNNLTLEKEIEDKQIRELVYDKELIYYCLCQILMNKLNNSIDHNCVNCETECPGLIGESQRLEPNDCLRWMHDFRQDCKNNISDEERALLRKPSKQWKKN